MDNSNLLNNGCKLIGLFMLLLSSLAVYAAPSGTIHLPFNGQNFDNNIMVSATVEDPDGIGIAILQFSSGSTITLCNNCGTGPRRITQSGIYPPSLGLSPGGQSVQLLAGPSSNELSVVASSSFTWNPKVIEGVSVVRVPGSIQISWDSANVPRYSVYISSVQNISPDNINALPDSQVQYGLQGTQATFSVSDDDLGMFGLVTGSDSSGESSYSGVFRIEAFDNQDPDIGEDEFTLAEDTEVSGNLLENDSDPEGSALTAELVEQPAHGSVELQENGDFTYTPDVNFNGSDSFVYNALDELDGVGIGTVSLTVTPVADPPVAQDDSYQLQEDELFEVDALNGLLANDADVDEGDELSVFEPLSINTEIGELQVASDGSFSYAPPLEFSGTVSFDYTVVDAEGDTDSASVTLTVAPVNDPPVVVDDEYNATENTELIVAAEVGVLSNDTDPDGTSEQANAGLVAALVNTTTNGELQLSADGSFSYSPAQGFNGVDSFTYSATDEGGASSQGSVTITVLDTNNSPIANDDIYSTPEDTPLVVSADQGVVSNDSDSDSDVLTATLISSPDIGDLTLNLDGSFSYAPAANASGEVSFEYQVDDNRGGTDIGTVALTITPVNDAPVANEDNYQTNEDTELSIPAEVGVLVNDTDVDDEDSLSASVVESTTSGNLVLNNDGSFVYTPNENFNGTDSFIYAALDEAGEQDQTTVTITVIAVNEPPVANDDSYGFTEDGGTLVVTAEDGLLGNDSDSDNDALTIATEPLTAPQHGSLVLQPSGAFEYTPNANFFGEDSFEYTVSDPQGETANATVTISVTPVNDIPVANDDSFTVNEDTPLVISEASAGLLANDTDADLDDETKLTGLMVSLATEPGEGALDLSANGTFTYTPAENFAGEDSFTYTVTDEAGAQDSATVTITVVNQDEIPIAVDDNYSTDEDTPLVVNAEQGLLANDSDPDGDSITVSDVVTSPSLGEVTTAPDGSFTYTPNENAHGTDTFTYQVDDSSGASATAVVTITIAAVNDNPEAVDDSYEVAESGSATLTPLDNDTDVDGDSLTIEAVAAESGSAAITSDATQISYTAPDSGTQDTLQYTISDGNGGTATASISISITGVNDAPVAVDDSATVNEDTAITIDVLANDSDEDGDTLSITAAATSEGTVSITSGGLLYIPSDNFNGSTQISYTVADGNGGSDSAVVSVTVVAVNDNPTAASDSATTDEDTAVTVDVLTNDSDVDGDNIVITAVSAISGTATITGNNTVEFTPEADFNGSTEFTYAISDNNGGEASATVSVTVTAVNDAPVAVDDTASAVQGDTINISPLDNDTDVDNDTLIISQVSASAGTATIGTDQTSVSFTAPTSSTDSVTIDYTVSDGNGGTDTGSIAVSITSSNSTPVAVADTADVFAGETITISVLDNDTDADNDTLSITSAESDIGTVSISSDNTTLSYTAPDDTTATATITYSIADPSTATATSTVTVSITEQTLTGDFDTDGDGNTDVSAVSSGDDYVVTFGNDVDAVYYEEDGEIVSVTPNDSGNFELTIEGTSTSAARLQRRAFTKSNGVWVNNDFIIGGGNNVTVFFVINGTEYSFEVRNLNQPNPNIAFKPSVPLESDFSNDTSLNFYTKEIPHIGALRTGTENGEHYELFESGSGTFSGVDYSSQLMWSIVNGVIEVDFVAPPEEEREFINVYALDDDDSDGIAYGVITKAEADAYVAGNNTIFVNAFVSELQQKITLIRDNKVSVEAQIETVLGYRIDPSQHPEITSASTVQTSTQSEFETLLLLEVDSLKIRPLSINNLSSMIAMSVPSVDSNSNFEGFFADGCAFTQDTSQTNTGTGACASTLSFTWVINNGVLEIAFSNGISAKYRWLDALAVENTFVIDAVKGTGNDQESFSNLSYWIPAGNLSDSQVSGFLDNNYFDLGKALTAPFSYNADNQFQLAYTDGFYFDSNGQAKRIMGTFDIFNEARLTDNDHRWSLDSGNLEILALTNNSSNETFRYTYDDCVDMSNADCFAWQKWDNQPIAISGDRLWLVQSVQQNENGPSFGNGVNYSVISHPQIEFIKLNSSVPGAPNSIIFNQEPQIDNPNFDVEFDTPLSGIDLLALASDPENDALSLIRAESYRDGSIVIDPTDSTVTYTPAAGFSGTDFIDFIIFDGVNEVVAYAIMNVKSQNVAPVAVDDTATAFATQPTTLTPLDNDTDANNDDLIVSSASVDQGTVVVDPNDNTQLIYTSASAFVGTATITYQVSDQRGGTDTGQTVVTVSIGNLVASYDLDNSGTDDFTVSANGNLYSITFGTEVDAAYVKLNGKLFPLSRGRDGSFHFYIDPSDTSQPEIFYVIDGVEYSFTPENLEQTTPTIGFGAITTLSSDFGTASSYELITRFPATNSSLSTAFENGNLYQLQTGGTGHFSSTMISDTVTWSSTNGTISVNFDNPVERTVFYRVHDLDDEHNNDGALGLITRAEADAYVAANNTDTIDVYVSTVRHELTGSQNNGYYFTTEQRVFESLRIDGASHPEITSTNATNGSEVEFFYHDIDLLGTQAFDFMEFTYDQIAGSVYMPVGRVDGNGDFTEFAADECSFSESSTGSNSGSGSCTQLGMSFTWNIVTGGGLDLVFNNGLSVSYSWLTHSDVENTVFVEANDGSKSYSTLDFWMGSQFPSTNEINTLLSGNYMETSLIVTNPFNYDSSGNFNDGLGEGFFLDNNGQAKEIFAFIDGNTNQPSARDNDMYWDASSSSIVTIEARSNQSSNDAFRYNYAQCTNTANADCFAWLIRGWQVLAIDGDRLWVLETEVRNDGDAFFNSGINYSESKVPKLHFYQLRSDIPGAPNSLSYNQEPVISFTETDTAQDTPVNIDLLALASDPEGDTLSLVQEEVDIGSLVNNGDGTVTYTPPAGYNGEARIFFDISDAINQVVGFHEINVGDFNNAPVAFDDTEFAIGGHSYRFEVLFNDFDDDNDYLTISSIFGAVGASISADRRAIDYTAPSNITDNVVVEYEVSDGNGGSDTAQLFISITPNSAPVANDDSDFATSGMTVTLNPLDNDTDADFDQLIITSASSTDGTAVVNGDQQSIDFTASISSGTAIIDYAISDGYGGTDTGQINVTVSIANSPPIANDDSITVAYNSLTNITVLDNDYDPDTDPLTIISASANVGSAQRTSDDLSIDYTAPDNGSGDTIFYDISDGNGGTASATVFVTFNLPPSANDDSQNVTPGTNDVTLTPLDNDTDPEGIGTVTITSAVINDGEDGDDGTVQINTDLTTLNYSAPTAAGSDLITYTIEDDFGNTDTGTITITIATSNNAPVANTDSYTLLSDSNNLSLSIGPAQGVLHNDTDADADSLTVSVVPGLGPSHADTFLLAASGGFIYQYSLSSGATADSFVYEVSDGTDTHQATVHLTIQRENFVPEICGIPKSHIQAGETYSVLIDVIDPEAGTVGLVLSNNPGWLSASMIDTDTWHLTGTPTTSDLGTSANVTLAATDNIDTEHLTFDLTVHDEFGTAGGLEFDFGGTVETVRDIAIDNLGNIVVVGSSDGDFAIARFKPDGTADPGFNSGTPVIIDFNGGDDEAVAVAITSTNGLIVAGTSNDPTASTPNDNFGMTVLYEDGSPDTSFHSGTPLSMDIDASSLDDTLTDLILHDNGNMTLIGYTNFGSSTPLNQGTVVQLLPGGTVNPDFASGGTLSHVVDSQLKFKSGLLDHQGYGYLVGVSDDGTDYDISVTRITDTGIDTSFATNGTFLLDDGGGEEFGYAAAFDKDGGLILVGEKDLDLAIYKVSITYNTGTMNYDVVQDSTFNAGNGSHIIALGTGTLDIGYGIVSDKRGNYYIAAKSDDDTKIVKIEPSGTLVTSYGTSGIKSVALGSPVNGTRPAITLDGFGQLLIADVEDPASDDNIQLTYDFDTSPPSFGHCEIANETADLSDRRQDFVFDAEATSDDHFYIVGSSQSADTTRQEMAIASVSASGMFNSAFGNNGYLRIPDTDLLQSIKGQQAVVLSDDSLVIVGYDVAVDSLYFAKVDNKGVLDSGFGTSGIRDLGTGYTMNDIVAAQAVTGDDFLVAGLDQNFETRVYRFNSDGSDDLSFGGGSTGTSQDTAVNYTLLRSSFSVKDMVTSSTGEIYVIGTEFNSYSQVALTRLGTDGVIDTSFGSSGYTNFDQSEAYQVKAADSNGTHIYVLGYDVATGTPNIYKYTSSGFPDDSFANNGIATLSGLSFDVGNPWDIKVDASGNIWVMVSNDVSTGDDEAYMYRLDATGQLDVNFVNAGRVMLSHGVANWDGGAGVKGFALDSNDEALIYGQNNTNFMTSYMDNDGIIINHYAVTEFDFGFGEHANNVLLDETSGLILAGEAFNQTDNDTDFSLARFDNTGVGDNSFGTAGQSNDAIAFIDPNTEFNHTRDASIAANGEVTVTGETYLIDTVGLKSDSNILSIRTLPGIANEVLDYTSQSVEYNTLNGEDAVGGHYIADDGSRFVVGSENGQAAVLKYDRFGAIVTNFASGAGYLGFSLGNSSMLNAVTMVPDGYLMAVGYVETAGSYDGIVVRFDKDGILDGSFGSAGVYTFSSPGSEQQFLDVAIGPFGNLMIAGIVDNDALLASISPTGATNEGLNTSGDLQVDLGSEQTFQDAFVAVEVDAYGGIVLLGQSGNEFVIKRYQPDGIFLSDYGGSRHFGPINKMRDIAIDSLGNIFVTGSVQFEQKWRYFVVRFPNAVGPY